MEALHLAIALIVILVGSGYIGYQIGFLMGKGMAETEVIVYSKEHEMSLTSELIRDLYPIRNEMNSPYKINKPCQN